MGNTDKLTLGGSHDCGSAVSYQLIFGIQFILLLQKVFSCCGILFVSQNRGLQWKIILLTNMLTCTKENVPACLWSSCITVPVTGGWGMACRGGGQMLITHTHTQINFPDDEVKNR
jgi:hypothetical protein